MKHFLLFSAIVFCLSTVNTFAQDGSLDLTFNSTGYSVLNIAGSDYSRDVAVQSDGKIVVVGDYNGNKDIYVLRYNQDGTLDLSFNSDGIFTRSFGSGDEYGRGIAIQGDGKILVTGSYSNGSNMDVFVLRLDEYGELDPTFNSTGIVTFSIGTAHDNGYGICIDTISAQPKILVCGNTDIGGIMNMFVARLYQLNGSFDNTFSGDGIAYETIDASFNIAYKVGIMTTGKIVAGGTVSTANSRDIGILCFNNDGTLNTGFNTTGKQRISVNNGDEGYGMAIQPDNKIVVGGQTYAGYNYLIAVRVNPNGTLDNTFASSGKLQGATDGELVQSLALSPSGKIILSGKNGYGSTSDFGVWRLNSNGTSDNTFGSGGKKVLNIGGTDMGLGVTLRFGNIYVVGTAYVGAYESFVGSFKDCFAPTVTSQPTDASVCEGGYASFMTNASGSAPLTYQWYNSASIPVGGNSFILEFPTANMSQSDMYYCVVTNACGSATSDVVSLTVNSAPMAYAGEDAALCQGSSVMLEATGGDTYSWSNGVQQGVAFIPTATTTYTVTVGDSFTGCTATDQITLTINPNPTANAGADQLVCAGTEVTLTATGGDDYQWSGDAMQGMPFIPLTTTTYTVTVTNTTTWCSATDQVIVTLKPSPEVNGGTDQTVCESTSVSFTATATGAITPYTYAWSGGIQQSVPFMVEMTTEYYVTVTAGNGCTDVDTVMMFVNPRPFAFAGSDELICAGSSVTLTASGGDTYLWSTGSSSESITVSPTATMNYIVTVYSPEMCFSKDTVVVVVEQVPVVDAGTNQTLCANNASATLAGSVTNAPGLIWSGGNGYFVNSSMPNTNYTPSSDEISAGSVTLTLTSSGSQQCSDVSDQVTISFTPAPVVNAGTDQTLCSANFPVALSGSVTVATGGVWSGGNGTFTPNANSLTAAYTPSASEINNGYVMLTLTSTGNGSCSPEQDDIMFTIEPAPVVDAGTNVDICAGEPAELQATIQNAMGGIWTGGSGSFSPNNTSLFATYTPSLSEVTAGSVTLTLTSTGNGTCSAVADQITIAIHANPTISIISANDVLCYNACSGSAEVAGNGGVTPYSYQWSFSAGGATTAAVTNLCAEAHQVTVTDAWGCTATQEIVLSEPDQLAVSVSGVVNNNCWGGSSGVINTTVIGGNDPYVYNWSNGAVTANASGLPAGTYAVTVVDDNGCYAYVNNITVGQPQRIQIYVNTTNAMCNQSDGTATATVTGGTSPYSYLWSNGQNQNPATDLSAGSYSVIVTDYYGCVSNKFFNVSNSGGFTLSEVITDVSCAGGNDGAIDVTINGGTSPFTIEWSNGATTEDISGLAPGAYDIMVTDNSGCMGMEMYEVAAGNNLSYTSNFTSPSCGSADGSITLTATGGIAPYAYNWSTGATTNSINGLNAGNYMFTITDDAGCEAVGVITLASTGGAVITVDNVVAAACGGTGEAHITVTGGTAPYTYAWSDLSTDEDLTNAAPGMYYVSVTDQTGCMTVEDVEIPSILLPVQPICVVTVDTAAGRNMVVWERVAQSGIDYFKIYRETSIPDQYQHIASVDDTLLSEYIDYAANPFVRSFRYKLSAVDGCGNESDRSAYHKTLHLTMNQGVGQSFNLIWDDYEGFTYYSFIIMRYLPATGWVILDTLPKTLHSYTDAPPATSGIRYLVRVDTPGACISTTPGSKEVGGPYSSSFSNMEDEGLMVGAPLSDMLFNLSINPNPASDKMTIRTGNYSGNSNVRILNVTGQVVYSEDIFVAGDVTISLDGFARGVYMVEMKADKVYRGKLIIE